MSKMFRYQRYIAAKPDEQGVMQAGEPLYAVEQSHGDKGGADLVVCYCRDEFWAETITNVLNEDADFVATLLGD